MEIRSNIEVTLGGKPERVLVCRVASHFPRV